MSETEKKLTQAMWEMYSILGFDTDGDSHPDAMIAGMGMDGFIRVMLDAAREMRKDYDALLEEVR